MVDPKKFSAIAHRRIEVFNPIGESLLMEVIETLRLSPGSRVLDIGCGRGEVLLRVVERYRAFGLGIDLSPELVADASARAVARVGPGQVIFRAEDARTTPIAPGSFDLFLCLGATHALGGWLPCLDAGRRAVPPGGLVLIGEGYWKRPPDPTYLAVLQATPAEFTDDAGNVSAGERAGMVLVKSWRCSDRDWDSYEGAYVEGVVQYAREHPEDPDSRDMLERIRRWEAAYRRWGRDTLGLGLYLFRRGGG